MTNNPETLTPEAALERLAGMTKTCLCLDPDADIEELPLEDWVARGGCRRCHYYDEHSEDCENCGGTGTVARFPR